MRGRARFPTFGFGIFVGIHVLRPIWYFASCHCKLLNDLMWMFYSLFALFYFVLDIVAQSWAIERWWFKWCTKSAVQWVVMIEKKKKKTFFHWSLVPKKKRRCLETEVPDGRRRAGSWKYIVPCCWEHCSFLLCHISFPEVAHIFDKFVNAVGKVGLRLNVDTNGHVDKRSATTQHACDKG